MAFLREKDYFSIILESELDIIDSSTLSLLQERERAAQEELSGYMRHRYDVDQAFKTINTYSYSTAYNENDLIEWSETAYDATATYVTGDRVSESGNIYSSIAGNAPKAFDSSEWTLLTTNQSLWYARRYVPASNLPTGFAYSASQYTSNHQSITGWNVDSYATLYFKHFQDQKIVKIYSSSANRTADTSEGYFPYDPEKQVIPMTLPITPGDNETLGGFIDVVGYLTNDLTWDITASNYWTLGDNRNQLLKQIMIDVTLYHTFARIQPRNIPELRKERYDGNDPQQKGGAIGMLKNIQKGIIQLDLPVHHDNSRGQNFTYGGKPKESWDY